jgi:hypothetical protein
MARRNIFRADIVLQRALAHQKFPNCRQIWLLLSPKIRIHEECVARQLVLGKRLTNKGMAQF